MSSMNFPNLSLPTPTANPMSNPMGRNYMSDPNANLAFAKNSGAASGGGGGGAAPIGLEQQIQTLTQECAAYSKANPGGAQDVNCQQRLNQLIQSRNAATPQQTPDPSGTTPGSTSGNKSTQTKAYANDPDLDEMERLHQMLLVNNSPYQQQQLRARIGDILYKRQQADKRQEAADSHQAYLDRLERTHQSFEKHEAARAKSLADRKAQSEAAHTRVAAKNAAADSSNRDAYATALAEGRISPEDYARLMGDTLGEGSNTTVAPQKAPPTIVPDSAKIAGVVPDTPSQVVTMARARRLNDKNSRTPTSPMPAAEPEASRFMGPTTADLYPNGMPGDTPSMTERFSNTTLGQAAGAAGNFIKSFFPEKPDYKPPVENKPATNPSRSFEATLPTTLRQNNPRLSNQAKLRELQSTYSVYMHNLQNAAERGEISSDEFRSLRDAATNNYYLEQDIIGGAISDAAPAPVPTPTPPPPQSRFAAGLNATAAAGASFGNAVGSAFDAADNAKLAVDREIGNTVGPVVEGIGNVGGEIVNQGKKAADYLGVGANYYPLGEAPVEVDMSRLVSPVASGIDALTSAKDAIQLKTGQAMQALLNELSTGRITMEQFNKLRDALSRQEYRAPRAPN